MSWDRRVRALACALVGTAALAAAGTAAAAPSGTSHRWPGNPLAGKHRINNDTVTSSNWSGYAVEDSGHKFTNVMATWVQPSVTCTSRGAQYSSFWAGIDGYSSSSVEQTGSDSDCVGRNRASYYAWYEMYPANSVELSTTTYPVHVGDTMTSAISVNSSSQFTLSLTDSPAGGGRGWIFTTIASGSGLAQSSAEAIVESPEICNYFSCSLASLANFGTANFSSVDAAAGGGNEPFANFPNHEIIAQTSNGTVKAQPSALNTTGTSFNDTWKHS